MNKHLKTSFLTSERPSSNGENGSRLDGAARRSLATFAMNLTGYGGDAVHAPLYGNARRVFASDPDRYDTLGRLCTVVNGYRARRDIDLSGISGCVQLVENLVRDDGLVEVCAALPEGHLKSAVECSRQQGVPAADLPTEGVLNEAADPNYWVYQ